MVRACNATLPKRIFIVLSSICDSLHTNYNHPIHLCRGEITIWIKVFPPKPVPYESRPSRTMGLVLGYSSPFEDESGCEHLIVTSEVFYPMVHKNCWQMDVRSFMWC